MADVAALTAAYRRGDADPVAVAEAFLAAQPVGGPVDAFVAVDAADVLSQARASAARLAAGTPRGPLEGVPVAVKDEIHVAGYPTRGGTRFLADVADADARLVTRLRDAGAVITGKTRMTELGLSPMGPNAVDAAPRNPHDPARITGGSSSGSAVAVAAGLVPLAVGSDGGGSLRIPPALCGVLGLKPTYGQVDVGGGLPLGWWSTSVTGPIAGTVADLALGYAVMAERPLPDLDDAGALHVAVDWSWWGIPDPDVDRICRDALTVLAPAEVSIPHLELVQPAAYVTILAELAAAMDLHLRTDPRRFGPDTVVALKAARALTAVDYVRAQQARTLIAEAFRVALTAADVLVTPTTPCTAVALPEGADAGRVDEALIGRLTRYTFAANLAGVPAVSLPVGATADGLPVGLQLTGREGGEPALLRLAARLERDGIAKRPTPALHHELLRGA